MQFLNNPQIHISYKWVHKKQNSWKYFTRYSHHVNLNSYGFLSLNFLLKKISGYISEAADPPIWVWIAKLISGPKNDLKNEVVNFFNNYKFSRTSIADVLCKEFNFALNYVIFKNKFLTKCFVNCIWNFHEFFTKCCQIFVIFYI